MGTWIDAMSLLWAKKPNMETAPQAETTQPVVTVPLVNAEQNTQAKLDTAGNVPLVTNPQKNEAMGLGIEKTSTQASKVEEPKTTKAEAKQTQKTGESIDERLTRYYTNYKKASREEKETYLEKYITQHYKTLKDKPRSQQIKIQLADFKKLLANTKDGDDYEMLAAKINVLEKENQVLAAQNATEDQESSELRARGEIGVARSIHQCHADNQEQLTKLVVNSKNEKAIGIGVSHAGELAKEHQVAAVQLYENAEVKDDFKKQIEKTIINQYEKFAKENQVDIHKIMSSSKFSETVEYAASNIYKFDKSNQVAAMKVTTSTGNTKAITAAAAQYDKYDKSVQSEIKTIIAESTTSKTTQIVSETSTSATETKDETTNESMVEQIKKIATSPNSKNEIEKLISKASDNEKINLLKSLNPVELASVVNCILASNPSSAVIAKIIECLPQLGTQQREAVLEKIGTVCSSEVLFSQLTRFDAKSQLFLAKKGLNEGKERFINTNLLSTPVKEDYTNLFAKRRDKVTK